MAPARGATPRSSWNGAALRAAHAAGLTHTSVRV